MMSIKNLLIEKFGRELDEASKYFGVKQGVNVKDQYDLQYANDLLVDYFPKELTSQEMFDMAMKFLNGRHNKVASTFETGIFYIPALKYLYDTRVIDFDYFCEMYMRLHLEKNKQDMYEEGLFLPEKTPFSISTVEKIDAILSFKDFYVGIKSIVDILNYIDYEKNLNEDNLDDPYIKALDDVYERFCNYLKFYLGTEEMNALMNAREKNEDISVEFNKDNLNLVKFCLGDVPNFSNSFYQFEKIEELLKSGDTEQKKKNLMAIFAYRNFDFDDPFFLDFSDLVLTSDELVKFVNEYEKTGKILSANQFENLLQNFYKFSLGKEKFSEQEQSDAVVKHLYKEFMKKDYALTPLHFISSYDMLGLDICEFERIINGNLLYKFSSLSSTKSFENYSSVKDVHIENEETAVARYLEESLRRRDIYKKYYDIMVQHQYSIDETDQYFIRNNVSVEDREDFTKLWNWFENTDEFIGWNINPMVAVRCSEKLLDDFLRELNAGDFKDRRKTLNKYLGYAVSDGVRKFLPPREFKKKLNVYTIRFLEKNSWPLFGDMCASYSQGDNLAECILKLGLSRNDALEIMQVIKQKSDMKLEPIIDKIAGRLDDDILDYREKTSEETRQRRLTEAREMISLYNGTSYISRKDYAEREQIPLHHMQHAVDFLKCENDPIYYAYKKRVRQPNNPDPDLSVGLARRIVDGILSGVELLDGGTRKFNYLDFRFATDASFGQFVTFCKNNEIVSDDELQKVQEFTLGISTSPLYSERTVRAETISVNVDGKIHEVSDEEKTAAFAFINELGLPREERILNLVFKTFAEEKMKSASDSSLKTFVKKESCN